MRPDIVISANNRIIAVLEIEITHRSVPKARAHAQRIFDGEPEVMIVAVLKVHKRRLLINPLELNLWHGGEETMEASNAFETVSTTLAQLPVAHKQ